MKGLGRRLAGLIAGQVVIQLVGFVTGFVLIRLMSIEDYAAYTYAFSFAGTLGLIVDVGIAGSVVGLVGDRQGDPRVVGRYLAAAMRLRRTALAVIVPVGGVLFALLAGDAGIELGEGLVLYGTVAVSVWARASTDFFSTPLEMAQEIRTLYRLSLATSLGRLAVVLALGGFGALGSVTASASNALMLVALGWWLRVESKGLFEPDAPDDSGTARAEILHYVKPTLPSVVFVAIQGQLTVFLAAALADVTTVAEVGALSRVAQGFAIFAALNPIFVMPRIATASPAILLRRYLQVLGVTTAGVAGLAAIGFLAPGLVVFVLGADYDGVSSAVGWSFLAAGLSYVGQTLYAMNAARRFIYWWGVFFAMGLTVAVQAFCVLTLDVGSTLGLQQMGAAVSLAGFLTTLSAGLYGIWRGPRSLSRRTPDV